MKERRIEKRTKIIVFIITALVIALALIIAVVASSETKEEMPKKVAALAPVQPSGSLEYQPVASITGPVNESGILADSPFIGKFENSYVALSSSEAKEIFGSEIDGTPPVLVIGEDGGFMLTVNAYDAGMLAVRGTVTVEGDTAVFSVETLPAVDFLGSDLVSFTMRLIDKDDMRYSGEQIGTITKGDIFTRVAD